MRAVTVAAAGAAIIGSVSAASHVKHMHAKLHANLARDTWLDWNATSTTTSAPVSPETTTTTASSSSSTTSVEIWGDWTTTSSAIADPTTTDSAEIWGDWSSASSATEDPAAAVTETVTWGDWTSTEADPTSTVTETWGDWSTSVDPVPTSTITETWADWTTASDPAATTTETWGDWESEDTTTVTLESTVTTTKYIQPITTTSSDWADWTSTGPVTSVITSTVLPVAALTADSGSCAITIITSYGLPTWYPTPIDPASTTTTSSSETWGDWTTTTTSTTPVAVISTTSTTSTTAVTWADWTSASTTPDAAAVTTSAETWGDWTSASTTPDAATVTTSTETWGDWASASTESAVATGSVEGGSWGWTAPSGSASASASFPKTSSSSHGGSPGITTNGDSWGLTYSPYTAQGGCKDAGTVSVDLAIIAKKGFTSVRVYSTDCSTLENIGTAARNNGLKLILGVWISSSGIGGAKGQVDDIVAWAQWDLVELIVVGNEAVFNGYASASELAGFVASSAAAFKGAGYTGLITLTEPLSMWEDTSSASAFCSVVDVVSANLYAFFNADVSADKAGAFIQSEIDILNNVCSGKAVYVLESGWPSAGNCNGAACPSPQNQAIALKGIQATVGAQVIFLSYEDEPWKEPGEFGVEQHWGCASVF
ncbi:murein transglycosylase [Capronia epimyces CBS 606.96]|uniref:Probable beta-glucosidase btgE n=1 Tax=Capronia epimyces CBS 606.96 TaxID=1182542 RepID=W9YQY9_9EURO|nr:murein transglycosylase [Capronia epimyces CBS 606.96]EXJ91681.1 murein transglycosylase [Capronia epimyces CBS 606.96]